MCMQMIAYEYVKDSSFVFYYFYESIFHIHLYSSVTFDNYSWEDILLIKFYPFIMSTLRYLSIREQDAS